MAQFVVRNLEDDVKARLKQRAMRHGCSTEEEVRRILRHAVAHDGEETVRPLGTRLASRFAGIGLEDDIPELRGQPATPADFSS